MKKIALTVTTLALALSAGSAAAATAAGSAGSNGRAMGDMGLGISMSNETLAGTDLSYMVNGKYFMAKDQALTLGFGFNRVDTGAAANATYTAIGFKAGLRKYLKTDELSPFVGGGFEYVSTRDASGANDISGFILAVEAGAEYFFSKQFSVEGSAQFGYLSADIKPVGGGNSNSMSAFGTTSANLTANFYF